MIASFETIYPAMTADGVYLVEDTHAAFWPQHNDRPDRRTFMQFAADRMVELHGWTAPLENQAALGVPAYQRAPLPASSFCRTTRAVHFYDSVVVFEREQRAEPCREVR